MRTRKRRRVGPGQKQRLRATRPGHVWAIDFIFDETSDQRRLKLCNIVDEFTREARVERTCTAEEIVAVIEDWRIEYNTYRPHSSLGGRTPPNTQVLLPTTNNQTTHKPWTTYRVSVMAAKQCLTPRQKGIHVYAPAGRSRNRSGMNRNGSG